MKLKVKLGRRQIAVIAVIGLAIAALLFSKSREDPQPGKLDADANSACSTFAAGYPRARSMTARLALADKVMAFSGRTDNATISKRAAEMGRSADGDNAAWKASADALTAACADAGWKPASRS